MKKPPKPKKPRSKRRKKSAPQRSEASPTRADSPAPLATSSPSKVEEPVFIRFGDLPEQGYSLNHLYQREEAGVSTFYGRKVKRGRKGSFQVDIPVDELTLIEAAKQSSSLVSCIQGGRPVFVVEGAQEVGRGSDDEPVITGGTLTRVSPFARIDLPSWWPKAKQLGGTWVQARKTVGFSRDEDVFNRAYAHLILACERAMWDIQDQFIQQAKQREALSDAEQHELLSISQTRFNADADVVERVQQTQRLTRPRELRRARGGRTDRTGSVEAVGFRAPEDANLDPVQAKAAKLERRLREATQ